MKIDLYFKDFDYLEADNKDELIDFYEGSIKKLNLSVYAVFIHLKDETKKRFFVDSNFYACIGFLESLNDSIDVHFTGFENIIELNHFLRDYYEGESIHYENSKEYKNKLVNNFMNLIREDKKADTEMIDFIISELETIKKQKN